MSASGRSMQSPNAKRLPPFGRALRELRLRGMVPTSQIVVSLDTWNYGRAFAQVVIPPELDPSILNFDFIAGLDCVVVRDPEITAEDRRDAVLRELLANDPASLRCIDLGDPVRWLWVKSRQVGIELTAYMR